MHTPRHRTDRCIPPTPHPARHRALLGSALALLVAATACGGGDGAARADADLPAAEGDRRLDGVCPSTVVVQLQWQPQSDMGALFGLLGPDHTVDTDDRSVTGTLTAGGLDTGVDLTLKAGGPAIGFQSVPSQMYADESVHFGLAHSDQLIAASGDQPVVGVTPLLKYSPAMLMWDPGTHPDLTIDTLADSGATVVVSQGQYYPAWLVAQGLVEEDQIDASYDGSPARFVGDPSLVQQGYANSEPYTYEHETPAWGEPVAFELLRDAGYEMYANNLTVRRDRMDELESCLERLVPLVQQAGADYVTEPGQVNETIADVVAQDPAATPYSVGEADYGAELLAEEGLLAPEDDGSIGTYDLDRVERVVEELVPVIRDAGSAVPADVEPDDLFTDRFTDHAIGLG